MAGEDRTCAACGTVFYVPKWKLDDGRYNQGTFCSLKCKHEAQTEVPSIGLAPSARAPSGTLRCTRCGETKPLDEFGTDSRKRNGKKSSCNPCAAATVWEWRQKYPDRYEALKKLPRTEWQRLRRRELTLRDVYHLTLADWDHMLAEQGGGCAVCGGGPSGPGRGGAQFHVDHDHACCPGVGSCGRCVRGILCSNCNTMIGLAKDDAVRLLAAAEYLQKFQNSA